MGKSKRSAEVGENGPDGVAGGPLDSPGEAISFGNALEQLEGTVVRLEEGEMPLEAALELFESGVNLSRQCSATLEAAERRIEILVADRGAGNSGEGSEAVAFESEEDWDDQHDDPRDDPHDDEEFED